MQNYLNMIRETLARIGRIGEEPRYVLGWMLSDHGTLDGLCVAGFTSAVRDALDTMAAAGPRASESVAKSYGI